MPQSDKSPAPEGPIDRTLSTPAASLDDLTRQGNRGPADGVVAPRAKWTILAAMALASLFLTLDSGMVSISFPSMVHYFSTDPSTVLWVSTAFFLTNVSLMFTTAWLADIFGR